MRLTRKWRYWLPVLFLGNVQCEPVVGPTPETARVPAAPDALRAAAVRSGEIELVWADQADDETRFEIQTRRTDGGSWESLASTPPNTWRYPHTNLRAGVTHAYQVRACGDGGCSAYSNEATATVTAPARPSGLTAAPSGSGRIVLAWKDNSADETRFELEYREAPAVQWYSFARTAPDIAGLAHLELRAGTTYAYRARACSDAGCSAYSEEAVATVAGPVAPSELKAEPVGSGRIDLRWRDDSDDEAAFRVEYREAPGSEWYELASTAPNVPAYSHQGLRAGVTYSYRVRSCNASGCSATREEVQAIVAGPRAPTGMVAVPVRSGRVDLRWQDESADEAGFRIEYREAPGVNWYELAVAKPNATAFSHIDLRAGTTFTYRVRACNEAGCSLPTGEAQATVLGPAAPSGLIATAAGSGRINLAWQDNSDDEATMRVEARAATSSDWSALASLAPNTRAFAHASLRAGDVYVYQVRACNASGCSAYSAEARATVAGPAAPSRLAATAKTGEIVLAWADNSGDEDFFELQSRAAASTFWTVLAKTAAGATSYAHSGLRAGDSYTYRVRACNVSGCSAFSGESSATVPSPAPPPAPTPDPPPAPGPGAPIPPPVPSAPSAGAQNVSRTPRFSWSAVASATSYRLLVAPATVALPADGTQNACTGCVIAETVTGTAYTPSLQLAAGTAFRWQVKATTSSGSSAWSTVPSFGTARETPAPLTCPSGWNDERRGRGVLLCMKEEQPTKALSMQYVLQVDLRTGARVRSVYHARSEATPSDPSPSFNKNTIEGWWNDGNAQGRGNRFCIVNGAAFKDIVPIYTPLSFPLYEGDELISRGSETVIYDRAVLFLNPDSAWIEDYTLAPLERYDLVKRRLSAARSAIVTNARERAPSEADAQTFVAVRNADNDPAKEIVLFYVALKATRTDAENTLRSDFDVGLSTLEAVAMDAGGSSQLSCDSLAVREHEELRGVELPLYRRVPHGILIEQAPLQ